MINLVQSLSGCLSCIDNYVVKFLYASISNIEYASLFKAVVGPFVGAGFAFWINSRKEEKKTKKINVVSGNFALFTLIGQYTYLLSIKDHLEKHRKDVQYRCIHLKAFLTIDCQKLKFDFTSLAYLLDGVNYLLFMRVADIENRFHALVGDIERHSEIHKNVVHVKIEEYQKKYNTLEIRNEQYNSMIGSSSFALATDIVNEIYRLFDILEPEIPRATCALREKLLEIFPDHDFIPIPPVVIARGVAPKDAK